MAFQLEKNALVKIGSASVLPTDFLPIISANGGNNGGNRLITVQDWLTYLEGELDDVVGDLAVTGTLTVDTINENTANSGVTIETTLLKNGGVSNGAETIFAGFFPLAAQNNITAGTGGAISVANYLTTINTDAGGDAFTLANGTVIGQLKKILLVVDGGGDAVITPANLNSGTTITMGDANDAVILIWNGTEWYVIDNLGSAIA